MPANLTSPNQLASFEGRKAIGGQNQDPDIVRLIAYVMSPANTIFEKSIGLGVFIAA